MISSSGAYFINHIECQHVHVELSNCIHVRSVLADTTIPVYVTMLKCTNLPYKKSLR